MFVLSDYDPDVLYVFTTIETDQPSCSFACETRDPGHLCSYKNLSFPSLLHIKWTDVNTLVRAGGINGLWYTYL